MPEGALSMQSLYFYLAHEAPVLRYSSSIPRIGDTILLPELGGDLASLKVFDVVWEFGDKPHVNVLVHHSSAQKQRLHTRWLGFIATLCR
jgi:hypothetical protein